MKIMNIPLFNCPSLFLVLCFYTLHPWWIWWSIGTLEIPFLIESKVLRSLDWSAWKPSNPLRIPLSATDQSRGSTLAQNTWPTQGIKWVLIYQWYLNSRLNIFNQCEEYGDNAFFVPISIEDPYFLLRHPILRLYSLIVKGVHSVVLTLIRSILPRLINRI